MSNCDFSFLFLFFKSFHFFLFHHLLKSGFFVQGSNELIFNILKKTDNFFSRIVLQDLLLFVLHLLFFFFKLASFHDN